MDVGNVGVVQNLFYYQAELIKTDLDKIIQEGGNHHVDPRREQPDIRYIQLKTHKYSQHRVI